MAGSSALSSGHLRMADDAIRNSGGSEPNLLVPRKSVTTGGGVKSTDGSGRAFSEPGTSRSRGARRATCDDVNFLRFEGRGRSYRVRGVWNASQRDLACKNSENFVRKHR